MSSFISIKGDVLRRRKPKHIDNGVLTMFVLSEKGPSIVAHADYAHAYSHNGKIFVRTRDLKRIFGSRHEACRYFKRGGSAHLTLFWLSSPNNDFERAFNELLDEFIKRIESAVSSAHWEAPAGFVRGETKFPIQALRGELI